MSVVGYKQIGSISDEYTLGIKGVVLFEDSCYVTVEPCRKQICIGSFGHLAEIVLIAGSLAVVLVVVVETKTTERHISGLRVRGLMSHCRTKGIDHPAGADHVRESIELMDPVKAHGDVPGDIHP